MLKKLVVMGVIGTVAFSALKGSKIVSYVRSEIASLRNDIESSIPPEKKLARIKNELKGLDKEIHLAVTNVARERVEVKELQAKVKDLRDKQSTDKELLLSRAAAIKAATEQVTFGNRTLSVAAATAELEEGMKRFTASQKSLESLEAALVSREKVRDGLEKQLVTLQTQKAELAAAVDALEAEITALKLKQMESKYQTDDTRLGKIKEDIRELRKEMDVEREKLKLMPAVFETPVAPAAKSVDEIIAPLGKPTGAKAELKVPTAE